MRNHDDETKNTKQNNNARRRGKKSGVGTSLPSPDQVLNIYPGSNQTLGMSVADGPVALRGSSVIGQDGPAFLLGSGGVIADGPQFQHVVVQRPNTTWPSIVQPGDRKPQSLDRSKDWGGTPAVAHLLYRRWDTSQPLVLEVPLYFPRDNLHYKFSSAELVDVCERLSRTIRNSSIQASFDSKPLSAKLETREGVELYVVFFQEHRKGSKNTVGGGSGVRLCDGAVYLSIQRRKGDKAVAAAYTQSLLEAAKGISKDGDVENEVMGDAPMNPESLMELESMIERLVADNQKDGEGNPFSGKSQGQISESAVQDVYSWLTSKRLDLRRQAMDYLLHMTDMRRTLSSTAIAGALVVIQGTGPSPGLAEQAQTIRNLVLRILMTREMPNDRLMLAGMEVMAEHDRDDEMKPYFPDPADDGSPRTLPHFYTDYMSQLFHIALQILVQSLEVVACFHETLKTKQGINVEAMARDLFGAAADVAPGENLYATLLSCIDHAESKLANGYLACKALRLLARGSPELKQRLRDDEHARSCIGNAFQLGTTCHTLLKVESEQLWLTVCAP